MTYRLRLPALAMVVTGLVGLAPQPVIAAPEPLVEGGTTAIPVPVVPALLTDEVVAPVETAATPTTDLPDVTPKAEPDVAASATPETAIEPRDTRPRDLASLVASLRSSEPGSRELECLAGAIYFESKSEPLRGQLAVGEVVVNRARSGRYPSSYCGVVYQRSQFSFVRGRSMPRIDRNHRQWHNAVAIAKIVDGQLQDKSVGSALFFHARHVSPNWRKTRVASIGNHIFYR